MSALVIAEHNNTQLSAVTANVVTAASLLTDDITVLVAGYESDEVAQAATHLSGVKEVLHCHAKQYEYFSAEEMSALIHSIAAGFSHILAPATTQGKNYLPRVAALLDVEQISEVIAIESSDTFRRPIYAGSLIATVQSNDPIKVLTIRGTAFDACTLEGRAALNEIQPIEPSNLSVFASEELAQSGRPELTSAKIVISGGRGLKSSENFNLLYSLADKLNAAVGASRAAVDEGFVPNDMQVGQTGKIVAPELYIAVGISGQIQHLAGMKDSKIVVAINKDEDAPIFQIADYGIVADLFDVLPELEKSL